MPGWASAEYPLPPLAGMEGDAPYQESTGGLSVSPRLVAGVRLRRASAWGLAVEPGDAIHLYRCGEGAGAEPGVVGATCTGAGLSVGRLSCKGGAQGNAWLSTSSLWTPAGCGAMQCSSYLRGQRTPPGEFPVEFGCLSARLEREWEGGPATRQGVRARGRTFTEERNTDVEAIEAATFTPEKVQGGEGEKLLPGDGASPGGRQPHRRGC